MKITRLELENYRGFPDAEIHFDGNSAILIGTNGAGKSTILDAVATAMAQLLKEIIQDESVQRSFNGFDFRYDEKRAQIQVHAVYKNNHYHWKVTAAKKYIKTKETVEITSEWEDNVKSLIETIHETLIVEEDSEQKDSVSIVVHYPTDRVVLDIPQRIRANDESYGQASALEDALSTGADFRTFFGWFRNQEDIENETKIQTDGKYVDPQLQAVREAIESFLPGFRNLRVKRRQPRVLIDKNGKELAVNQLSDGEKTLLTMVGDLARRLALANPGLPKPLEGQGLVLIDEVELHLHPAWQRQVIQHFQQTFPNVQFIFTTHSPQVISEVRDMKMFILSQKEDVSYVEVHDNVFGQDANYVLEDVMHVSSRNAEVRDRISLVYQQIEYNQLDEAEAGLRELEQMLGAEKPSELVKADALILRKRTIGR